MSIRIIHTIYPVTLQDLGRQGFRAFGVPLSGPMDPISHQLSNLLCGNPPGAVVLEITLHGLILLFEQDALIALCGGGSAPMLDGKPVGCFRPLFARQGSLLEFKPASSGCRMYLALAGGFKADEDMGSCATYVSAGIGGLKGRYLRKGDQLSRKEIPGLLSNHICSNIERSSQDFCSFSWGSNPFPDILENDIHLRFLYGPEWEGFSSVSRELFLSENFQVTDRSDRMGYQLSGPRLTQEIDHEMLSTGVCVGTVQVTHAGVPIILMADGQTTGGYPRIAHIITADIPLCGQLRPGAALRFKPVSEMEALTLYRLQMDRLKAVGQSIRIRFGL